MGLSASPTSPTLREQFRALEDERRRTWAPDALAINIKQRETLLRAHPATFHVRPGDVLPAAVLPRTDGGAIALDDLVAAGPAVLVFFRFAGCPACNIALPYYAQTLSGALSAAGVPLIALSPQPVELLGEIVARHALPFPVVSDTALALSRALGITYTFDDASRAAAAAKGGASHQLNGTDAWELPKPTVIVLDPGRVVRFVDVSPDWMDRTDATTILNALSLRDNVRSHAA
ncbi:alkyl hydroperoxide reductase [Ameyamaea chiangmaiensis NBRC 103196]|uniref:thioredoxin-dependent peroxiredoxin n=1 Tax=Ameyamaea chiangmaiensis TaxID=442969 RepID=A0A850P9E1_9PROT|nr:peroxiredoxin-like family protein [Ameyamaea chiangmaiensis]MBS4076363.1 AhpC/TSA family protein [Ameyamaea chiangmaiensis]NVN40518.1 AhpC/TSA family protein [Ameyamaea chiangmaiensis]GBQ63546.1 alkyl hydroperoxide reductase [Ameyamaea chiangmaiensis NBRC 103196]